MRRSLLILVAVFVLVVAGSSPSFCGRSISGALRNVSSPNLGDVGGGAQRPVGIALRGTCDAFRSFLGQPIGQEEPDDSRLSPAQQQLYLACLQMEQTANSLLDNGGPTQFAISAIGSLAELGNVLQQFGTEEFAAEGTNAAEISKGHVLLKRLAALRHGVARVDVSGVDLRIANRHVNGGQLAGAWGLDAGSVGAGSGIGTSAWPASSDSVRQQGTPSLAPSVTTEEDLSMTGSERWGLFANGMISFGQRDTTDREDGFDFWVPGITVGVDRRFGKAFVLGGALGYEVFNGNFDKTAAVAGGDLDSKALSVSAYSSYSSERFYLDGTLTYGWNDYDLRRNLIVPTAVNKSVKADTDGTQYEVTAAAGYLGHSGSFEYSPFISLSKAATKVDGYTEGRSAAPFNLQVEEQKIDSLVSVAGGQFSWTFSKAIVIVPQARVEWRHEFQNDDRNITARFVNALGNNPINVPSDDPGRNYCSVGAGVSTVWKGGTQGFINAEAVLGLKHLSNYVATVGIRFVL